jgi:polar amino acid transport system substrate-binding protein
MVYVVTMGFILLDLITGLIKAFKEKNYTSSVMREGLYHKIGSVVCILFGILTDYAQSFIDLGITIPIALTVCGYIILMEIGSIIENICIINPQILPDKLKSYFQKLSK